MSDSVSKPQPQSEGSARVPSKIGRYDVIEKLGSGSTGTVYKATDPFIGRVLAIKTFRVDLPPGPSRDRFLQRFYHEARISGGLSHPNIVALFDVGEVDGLPYLVFEHVDGPSLDVTLARAGRLDSAETIRVVEQTADALDFAHSKGVVHRDIRPANIILANDRRVRIADFGIARIEGSQLTQHGEILGTPAYMSPEQIRGHELSPETDLFSLAVCAYEMLCGQRPFNGQNQAELLEALAYSPPAEPKELRQLGIPSRDFMFVFERALAKDPSHRFADGASFARALKSCLGVVVAGDAPTPVSRISVPEAAPARRAILPPVAPPPISPLPPPPPPKTGSHFDASATAAVNSGGAAVASADATLIAGYAGRSPLAAPVPPVAPESPDSTLVSNHMADGPGHEPAVDASADATLVSSGGFNAAAMNRAAAVASDASSEATMLSTGSDADLLRTQKRLSRQEVESFLSKSSPAQTAAPAATPPLQKTLPGSEKAPFAADSSAIEDLLPPTREMPKPTLPTDSSRTASHSGGLSRGRASDDKTIIMTESEKQSAAKLKDLSAARIPTGSALPRPAPPVSRPSISKPSISKPPATAASPATLQASRPSQLPKYILGGFALLTAIVMGLGVWLLKSTGPKGSGAEAEMWNNLPVYPEAEVEKSPLLFSHEVPKPQVEPGKMVSVTVSWIVTPDGVVDDPKIISSASPEIDAFVMEAVRKWRYEPGQKAGKTVPVRVLRKYTFGQRGGSEGP